ncbi:MAG: exonuclease [Nitrososphaerota archaeon]|nr:exonuclease [Nitrososphaerota archaeon]MDG6966866.1 exonuclease [Nitrososphaerota archaeon]MDG6978026.1 exonuclease [Nitrososphaerota archaeon]MDG7020810.1 exonuclease [Nitrososphaerota archaeon]MDG7022424.1 exonuclease [Nitrososphaerota archaeon]
MSKTRVSLGHGIVAECGGLTFALDPDAPVRSDYTFVSHAHLDHVDKPHPKAKVLATPETVLLARARGIELEGNVRDPPEGVALLDSGHILGARALYVEDELLYTGDAAGRERAFMPRCRTKKARVLITETTFGDPRYVFPPLEETVRRVNEMIGRSFDKGRPVVLMGYPLGKSQVLSHLFSSWTPFFVHESVGQMNDIYRDRGVPLKREAMRVGRGLDGLPQGPWLMVAPMMGAKNRAAQRLRKEHRAVLAAFSGWATDGGYGRFLGADYSFAVSDHCDYPELLQLVREVSPEEVYTTHGFTKEFAQTLRGEGFDAKPLEGYQAALSDYP